MVAEREHSEVTFVKKCYSKDRPHFIVVSTALDDWVSELAKAIQLELRMCSWEVIRDDLCLYMVTLFFF